MAGTERGRGARKRERETGIETGTKKTRGSNGSEKETMERRRERERDDLLRRGPRLARRPCCARPPATPFGVPSTDPRRVYRCAPLPPTLSPVRCPLCHPPLHDPPGCDYLVLLHPLPHPSYLPYDASAATRRRTRTLGAPLLLAADAKAARRCTWRDGEGGERAE